MTPTPESVRNKMLCARLRLHVVSQLCLANRHRYIVVAGERFSPYVWNGFDWRKVTRLWVESRRVYPGLSDKTVRKIARVVSQTTPNNTTTPPTGDPK